MLARQLADEARRAVKRDQKHVASHVESLFGSALPPRRLGA